MRKKRNSIKSPSSLPRKTSISLKMQRQAPFSRTQASELSVFVSSERTSAHSRLCGLFGLYCNYSVSATKMGGSLRQCVITNEGAV